MSTTLLYRLLGVAGYVYLGAKYGCGWIEIRIDFPRERWRCSACGSKELIAHGRVMHRTWLTVPVGLKQIWLRFDVPRVECRTCGVTRQLAVPFAEPKKSYSRALARYVLGLLSRMTISDVAECVGLSWDTVKEIHKKYLTKRYAKPRLGRLRHLAIDEIAIGKGHRYVTIVMDLDSRAVVYVGEGKGADSLAGFWKRLKASGAKIKSVATDLARPYLAAVRKHLPKAKHVADPFHIVKLMNERLSDLRRTLYHELDRAGKIILKGTRWLLLKNPENLSIERDERERLDEALTMNQPLAIAYYLKEDLRQIWNAPDKRTRRRNLTDWIRKAKASGITQLKQMALTLGKVRDSILNHCDYAISTGPLEAINNKIQLFRRKAYGFRDMEYFNLRILALHMAKYELIG